MSYLKQIKIQNWRSHQGFEFSFPDTTILVGPNAIGKTNFLEAIYYISTGKSFRAKDLDLIGWEQSFSRVSAFIDNGEKSREVVFVLEQNSGKLRKTALINEQKVATSKVLGELPGVIFTPEEVDPISNLPEARRRYLNLIISQCDRRYAINLLHYKRALSQRNALLKRISAGISKESELEVWDGKLAEYADPILQARALYIKSINELISEKYFELSGVRTQLLLEYAPSIDPSEGWSGVVSTLTENRSNDVFAKVTTHGPHRDDFTFILGGRNMMTFASRGEIRTVVLALKLAELDYLESIYGKKPILLLDDVFSELDEKRRDALSQILVKQQTIITTTDLDHISSNIINKSKVINFGQ